MQVIHFSNVEMCHMKFDSARKGRRMPKQINTICVYDPSFLKCLLRIW